MITHFTLREMHELYRSWQMWLLLLVAFLVMSTGHPVTLPQFDSFGVRMAFWVIALFIYIMTSDLYSKLTGKMWHRMFGKAIPLVLLSSPLVLASTYASCAILTKLFEPHRDLFSVMTWQMNVRNVLVAHVFETVALLWLIPAQRERTRKSQHQRWVTLAGHRFLLSDIARVKAAEHFLEIHNETGSEVIRERMSTFLEQVTPEDGIQTHRSHWVSRRYVETLSGRKLRLICGSKIPVARGRLDEVRAWIEARNATATAA
ncbi:MAG: LytTR family DNA-binding domain-containing protein [Tateyamaria sp.]|uniref:LytTR family DNA-binding domain-containing protein n=1 Tax=Tateyamaria sp. TaxID=1929288 RepID=UPI00327E1BFD